MSERNKNGEGKYVLDLPVLGECRKMEILVIIQQYFSKPLHLGVHVLILTFSEFLRYWY